MDSVWTEKYRPSSLGEVAGQPQAVARLGPLLASGSLPHLLLAGPPGSGKTTCALILAREALGGMTEGNFLEIDASDLTRARPAEDGGPRRDSSPLWRIREFATNASIDGVSFRIAYIDGVDALPKEVQEALRRTMEVYSGNCAFILSCVHPSGVIDPVKSRCSVVLFNPVPEGDLAERLRFIAGNEGVEMEEGAAEGIAVAAEGDVRRAVLILQAAAAGGKVDLDSVYPLSGTPASAAARETAEAALRGDLMKARDLLDTMMVEGGMSGREIIFEMHRLALSLDLGDQDAMRLVDRIGDVDRRIAECGSGGGSASLERVQLESLLAYLAMTGRARRR